MIKIKKNLMDLAARVDQELQEEYQKIDDQCLKNSLKVLEAFHQFNVSESHFSSTTGYGYNDIGRDIIEKVFAKIFKAEDALVRNQFISGSHALTVALFSILRPQDILLSISGTPYDTLHEVIGIKNNASSLKAYNIKYEEIALVNNDFDYSKIADYLTKNKVKLIEIQRSKGYSLRKSISISKINKVVKLIKSIDQDIIVMVDNCYCEFVEDKNPLEVGADLIVGSLIKNLGGGIASNGAYIAGRKDLIALAGERLNLPGEGRDVGPSLGSNKSFLQGLYMAPSVVANSLKTALFTALICERLGIKVEPLYNEKRTDIVQSIIFEDSNKLIKYVQGIQSASAIDAHCLPEASDMPGYTDKIIMASGSFTQGSSIEISCDGPLKEPYIAFQQGGLTFEYGKIAVLNALSSIDTD